MNTLDSLFKNIRTDEPDKALEARILQALALARDFRLKRRLLMARAGFAGSLFAAVTAGFAYGQALLESDFWHLLPLLFSDISIVAQHWNDFLFSLMETFPAFALAALLTPIFFLLMSFRFSFPTAGKYHYNRLTA